MKRIRRIRHSELPEHTVELARFLIGKTLVHDLPRGRLGGRIVEAEGYLPGDAACHAFNGPTRRNRALFLEHGHAYVYFVYGAHYMLNVSSERPGIGAGILLRAIEPVEGIEAMKRHRGTSRLVDLARGPGRLAEALRITPILDGLDMCGNGPLWLGTPTRPTGPIGVSVRIGITKDADRLLRFYERGNPFVSGPKRLRM
jgi:DNA-3-methyladenine glycosylase